MRSKASAVIDVSVSGFYAAADLQRAHDELGDAERSSAQGRYNEPRAYAQRAQVDADVAVARGNSAEREKAAEDVTKTNSALRQKADRGGGASAVTNR